MAIATRTIVWAWPLLALWGVCFARPALAAPAAEAGLALPQAIGLALEHHPRIHAAKQRVAAQSGLATSAGAFPNPELLLVPLGTLNDNPVILSQEFDLLGKRRSRRQAASAEVRAAMADLRAVESLVVQEVTTAYVDLLEAAQVRALTEESVAQAQTLHRLSRQRFDLGDVPQVHVTRTEIEAARLEQELVEAAADVRSRQAALNAAIGRDPGTPVTPVTEWQERPLTTSLDTQKQHALAQRPELEGAAQRVQARQRDASAIRARRLPDLIFQARAGSRIGGTESTQVGLGLSLPLLDLGSIRGQVSAAQAQAREQEALLAQTRNEIALQVETAHQRVESARAVAGAYRERITPQAEGLLRALQQGYEQGGTTLPEVLDAQRTLTATRIEQARAVARYRRALSDLEWAVGGKLP